MLDNTFTPAVLNRYQNSIENLRSHHWKYWLDLYSNCQFDCQYCVYRESGPMGEAIPHPERLGLLERDLAVMPRPGITYLGPQSDVYQPLEKQSQLTRRALELFLEHKRPVFTVTRSSLVLRDKDVLQQLAAEGLVEVSVTVSSQHLIHAIEPRTMDVAKRIDLISQLKRLGIPTSAHMSPIIPHVDSIQDLHQLMDRLGDSGADCIYACVLGVTPAYHETVVQMLTDYDPGVGASYQAEYPESLGPGVTSANGDYVVGLMTSLSEHATVSGLPFSSAHLPILDTCERNGSIFRYKLPTVGDIVRACARKGVIQFDFLKLIDLVASYKAVDALYTDALSKYWNDETLFKNTFYRKRNATYILGDTCDFGITNMKVTNG